ncbi:MAG TPA: SRPBCC domain-containing protein [Ktedonobacteraceae bacterium]
MSGTILQSARLHCRIEHAFALFTRNELLQTWLTRTADVEPVVDGRYELFWDPDDPTRNSTLGCKITAIEADTLLAFEWKGPAQFRCMNETNPLTHVAVFFTPCNEVLTPCTDVYLLHSGWGVGPVWEEARSYVARAWEIAFEELETTVNG